MKKIVLFDGNYLQKITMYGKQELNHQVIGMPHYQTGRVNEQNQLENINKKRQNKTFVILFTKNIE
jgi:hypothetical protein